MSQSYKIFINLLKLIKWKNTTQTWTAAEPYSIQLEIIESRAKVKEVFDAYQASRIGSHKSHILNIILMSIEWLKKQFFHKELYEASNRVFKTVYSKSSKQQWSEMDDAVIIYNAKLID